MIEAAVQKLWFKALPISCFFLPAAVRPTGHGVIVVVVAVAVVVGGGGNFIIL